MNDLPQKGIISVTKSMSKKEAERIRTAFEKAYTGPQKPGTVMLLKNGVLVERKNTFWQRVRDLFERPSTIEFMK